MRKGLLVLFAALALGACVRIPVVIPPEAEKLSQEVTAEQNTLAQEELGKVLLKDNLLAGADDPRFLRVKRVVGAVLGVMGQHKTLSIANLEVGVVIDDAPIISSVPPNHLIISSAVLNAQSPWGVENDAALTAVVAHELCHLYFGHTQQKLFTTALHNVTQRRKVAASAWNLITLPLPIKPNFVVLEKNVDEVGFDEWFFECAADMFALIIMQDLGYSPADFYGYIQKLEASAASDKSVSKVKKAGLKMRLERVHAYMKTPHPDQAKQIKERRISAVLQLVAYENGAPASLYTVQMQDEPSVETLKRINYWDAATRQNNNWCRTFACVHDSPLTLSGKETGIFVNILSIPVKVNGYESFVLPRGTTFTAPQISSGGF